MPRRGTNLDPGNRFTTSSRERFDDGWESVAEEPDPRTELIDDASRSAFATNSSPDIPFTHSINPYRGCEHGCAYCQDGDTPILMADGSNRALADLRVGDRIYGTIRRGAYHRYVITDVRAHWTTRKEAYRITLADGRSLVASGDHRYLTVRGWEYVMGSEQGRPRRPHLRLGSSLMGIGGLASQSSKPHEDEREYLCGVNRIDSALTTNGYDCRDQRASSTEHGYGLAMEDEVALGHSMRLLQFASVEGITSRRSIEGRVVTSSDCLDVVEIEPLGRWQELFDITTGTEDFIANGVVSHNCYARPTHEYLGYNAGIDFETKIVVKRDAARLAREEMMKKSWRPTPVSISGVTDPYQPIERNLGITRSVLETMLEFRNPVAIITKNALVLRDLDLLAEMAKYGGAAVFLSITTLDRDLARRLEPRTSSPALRLHAVRTLTEAGVPVGVAMAPLIPGLTDSEIPMLLAAAREAGARWTFYTMLRVPLAVRPIFIDWLEREEPGRAAKVLNALRDMRDGKLNISEFGSRMGGTGARADAIGNLFDLTARRLGFNVEDIPLTTDSFRRPGIEGQIGLFE